jgi:hypothetical protein
MPDPPEPKETDSGYKEWAASYRVVDGIRPHRPMTEEEAELARRVALEAPDLMDLGTAASDREAPMGDK